MGVTAYMARHPQSVGAMLVIARGVSRTVV
jgi:hypothetical protein